MTLGLNTEEVVQALDAKGYIDAMEEAFTELGKGAAINSPRTETGIPLLKYGADERIKTNARELLRDIVVSATTSLTPVFEAKWLNEGTHLGSINIVEADRQSFTPLRSGRGQRAALRRRASDLVRDYVMGKHMDTVGSNINKKSKKLNWQSMRELGELLTGKIKGRQSENEITFHCNDIGLGVQHAATGSRILANARRLGLGKEIPTDWFLQKEHT